MNSRLFFLPILIIALSLTFVYAADSQMIVADGVSELVAVSDIQKQEPVKDMTISLISPVNEKVFELVADGGSIDIGFGFTVEPMDPQTNCVLNVWGTNDYALKTEITDSGKGIAFAEFKEGEYKWNVECIRQGVLFKSQDVYYFKIKSVEVPNNQNPNTNTNTGNGGGSSNNDDESNGRRFEPISLPLEKLSTESSEDSDSSPGITGAFIGALGNKSVWGIIGLFVLLALIGAFVYNRRKLGIVKKD